MGVSEGLEDDSVLGGAFGKHELELGGDRFVDAQQDFIIHGALCDGFSGGDHYLPLDGGEGVVEEGGRFPVLAVCNLLEGGFGTCSSCSSVSGGSGGPGPGAWGLGVTHC